MFVLNRLLNLCALLQSCLDQLRISSASSGSQDSLAIAKAATMLVSLTVGKVDAGVTVLLTPDKRLVRLSKNNQNGTTRC